MRGEFPFAATVPFAAESDDLSLPPESLDPESLAPESGALSFVPELAVPTSWPSLGVAFLPLSPLTLARLSLR